MEYVFEIYALVILLGIALLYGFYKITRYAFWFNQLWIASALLMVYIMDSTAIPFLLALVYFGYTLLLLNVIGFVIFKKEEFMVR